MGEPGPGWTSALSAVVRPPEASVRVGAGAERTASETSMTASFSVCMWTDGVSLYNSTASHPLSLFKSTSYPGGYITCLAPAIVRFRWTSLRNKPIAVAIEPVRAPSVMSKPWPAPGNST